MWGPKLGKVRFSPTRETYGVHAQAAITCLHHLIMNTVTGCYACGQALGLNAVIPASAPCFS